MTLRLIVKYLDASCNSIELTKDMTDFHVYISTGGEIARLQHRHNSTDNELVWRRWSSLPVQHLQVEVLEGFQGRWEVMFFRIRRALSRQLVNEISTKVIYRARQTDLKLCHIEILIILRVARTFNIRSEWPLPKAKRVRHDCDDVCEGLQNLPRRYSSIPWSSSYLSSKELWSVESTSGESNMSRMLGFCCLREEANCQLSLVISTTLVTVSNGSFSCTCSAIFRVH